MDAALREEERVRSRRKEAAMPLAASAPVDYEGNRKRLRQLIESRLCMAFLLLLQWIKKKYRRVEEVKNNYLKFIINVFLLIGYKIFVLVMVLYVLFC